MLVVLTPEDKALCSICGAKANLSIVSELDWIDYCEDCYRKEMKQNVLHKEKNLVLPSPGMDSRPS